MQPQPLNDAFNTFFIKVYPDHSKVDGPQYQVLKTLFYIGGILLKNSASEGPGDEKTTQRNTDTVSDIYCHLQRYQRQLNRTPHPPIKGKLGVVFTSFLSKELIPQPPQGKPTLDCYNAFVAGVLAMLNLLEEGARGNSQDITLTRLDLIHNDIANNTGIEAWHVPAWPDDK